MKKLIIGVVGLIVVGLIVVALMGPKATRRELASVRSSPILAIDEYVAKNPVDPAAPQLRRLSAALREHPALQNTVLGDAGAHSVQDGSVSEPEAAMLQEAATIAERNQVTEPELTAFATKYQGMLNVVSAPASEPTSADASASVARASATIDTYIQKHPKGRGVAELRRISAAIKTPAAQTSPEGAARHQKATQVIAETAARSVQDGSVSAPEAAMLNEAATLAERDQVTEPELKAFSDKYPALGNSAPASAMAPPQAAASVAHATKTIDSYIQKHPNGRGVAQLRRISAAIKTPPAQARPEDAARHQKVTQVLAETAARSVQDGTVSKEDAAMLEEAATLAEDQGLSPSEMAEFSRKYATSQKPVAADIPKETAAAPLADFEGKQHLIYTFEGSVQCAPTPCTNIRVNVHVSSGKWVESREGGVNGQGRYSLQMPVLSEVHEKVLWRLEAHDKDLRKKELTGERVTAADDTDVTLQNNLLLNPA